MATKKRRDEEMEKVTCRAGLDGDDGAILAHEDIVAAVSFARLAPLPVEVWDMSGAAAMSGART